MCASQWKYLYRAADGEGHTIDFLLRAKRDGVAARRFLERVIDLYGTPEKIAIDKSGANTAAIEDVRAACGADIEMRQIKYVNNIVEQDHQLPCGGPSPWRVRSCGSTRLLGGGASPLHIGPVDLVGASCYGTVGL